MRQGRGDASLLFTMKRTGQPQTTGFSLLWFESEYEHVYYLSFAIYPDYQWNYMLKH